jgi:hypothetical protein
VLAMAAFIFSAADPAVVCSWTICRRLFSAPKPWTPFLRRCGWFRAIRQKLRQLVRLGKLNVDPRRLAFSSVPVSPFDGQIVQAKRRLHGAVQV